MKKILKAAFLCGMLFVSVSAFAQAKKSIVCTIFPSYDWVMNVLGENSSDFDITYLLEKGMDMHSYQSSIKDIAKISNCDILIYVGGENDEWIEEVLSSSKKEIVAINMLEALGDRLFEEEFVEGMQVEEEDDDEEADEVEYDEHVWLSLKNSIVLVNEISKKIQNLDSKNASIYKENTARYVDTLSKLDLQYSKVISKANRKTLLFADRFPFRYMAEDYGLNYYAAFVGCSAESEASFETVAFLAKKVDELNLSSILTIEKSDKKIARTVIANSKSKNQIILEMDSLQSVSKADIKKGKSYLSGMESNLEVLKQTLN